MIAAKVQHTNPKWIEKLRLRLQQDDKQECAVGFPRGKVSGAPHYDNGASILDVAIWNNGGTATIPARPFMEDSSKKIQVEYRKMITQAIPRMNAGTMSVTTVLKAAGLKSEAIIRNQIREGGYAPNSPETIKAKKSSQPLIWTGDMRKAVTSILRKRTR